MPPGAWKVATRERRELISVSSVEGEPGEERVSVVQRVHTAERSKTHRDVR